MPRIRRQSDSRSSQSIHSGKQTDAFIPCTGSLYILLLTNRNLFYCKRKRSYIPITFCYSSVTKKKSSTGPPESDESVIHQLLSGGESENTSSYCIKWQTPEPASAERMNPSGKIFSPGNPYRNQSILTTIYNGRK